MSMDDTKKEINKVEAEFKAAAHDMQKFKNLIVQSRKELRELDRRKRKLLGIKRTIFGKYTLSEGKFAYSKDDAIKIIEHQKLRYSWDHKDFSVREMLKLVIARLREVNKKVAEIKALGVEPSDSIKVIKGILEEMIIKFREPISHIYFSLDRQQKELERREFNVFLHEYSEQVKADKQLRKAGIHIYGKLLHALKTLETIKDVEKEMSSAAAKGKEGSARAVAAVSVSVAAIIPSLMTLAVAVNPEIDFSSFNAVVRLMVGKAHGIFSVFLGIPALAGFGVYASKFFNTNRTLFVREMKLAEKRQKLLASLKH